MIGLHNLKPPNGAKKKPKRIGRGIGSGVGKRSGRGQKGQGARSGGKKGPGFEGGQMPLTRRVPKKGFTNPTRIEYKIVNLSDLNRFEKGSVIDPQALKEARLVRGRKVLIKVLGNGSVDRGLVVRAHKFSKTAAEKIVAAGGSVEVIK